MWVICLACGGHGLIDPDSACPACFGGGEAFEEPDGAPPNPVLTEENERWSEGGATA